MTLGHLRNFAVMNADTAYVAQWDDDDFYHPDRLMVQMQAINSSTPACVLRRVLLIINGHRLISSVRDWEGTLVCRRNLLRYPSVARGEDTPVIDALARARKLARLDRPDLYAYIYHGQNTWDAGHWNEFIKYGSEINRPEQQALLDLLLDDTNRRDTESETLIT